MAFSVAAPARVVAVGIFFYAGVTCADAQTPGIEQVLNALRSVHAMSEVAISPDGKHVVYASQVSGKRGSADVDVSALWLANTADGSGAMRITACPAAVCDEHSAAWSPDSTRIAFVTTDDKQQTQIAIVSSDGRSLRTITHASGPLDTPRWSPDGRRIAFLYSEGAPKAPSPLNPQTPASGVQSETFYEQRVAVLAVEGGEPAVLGPADLNIYEFDWSPDGARFAVTAAHGSGDANWWIAELDVLDATSGAVSTLLKPAYQMASPRWSGDGKRIAFIGGLMSDEAITGGDVYVIAGQGGEAQDVTPTLAASVQTITWNGSPTKLVATEFAAGDEVIATIDVGARTQQELWRGPQLMIWGNSVAGAIPGDVGVSLSSDGRACAVILQSQTVPPEVATGPIGKWKPITHVNAGVRALTGKVSNVTWKSDGFNVQGTLVAPASVQPGKRYPLVVQVHGGPAYAHYPVFPATTERFDVGLSSQGYFVFQPNPRGSYGQGEAFTRANVKDFGYGDLRDILKGIDAVQAIAPIDPNKVGIMGWSYGGYMTMWAITQTDRFKAAVAGAGVSDWLSYYGTNDIDTWMPPYFGASVYDDPKVYERSSPITFIKNVHTPTLIVAGDRDAEVPISQSYEYWNALKRLGVQTEFVVYPDEGHLFFRHRDQADVMSRAVNWFTTHLN
jgi:dipeptidyl aminopeptidase/acylaminoacyl peptidase